MPYLSVRILTLGVKPAGAVGRADRCTWRGDREPLAVSVLAARLQGLWAVSPRPAVAHPSMGSCTSDTCARERPADGEPRRARIARIAIPSPDTHPLPVSFHPAGFTRLYQNEPFESSSSGRTCLVLSGLTFLQDRTDRRDEGHSLLPRCPVDPGPTSAPSAGLARLAGTRTAAAPLARGCLP